MWNILWSAPSKQSPSYRPVFIMAGIAAIIFSVGYMLKPVSDIVDELHDSDSE